MKEYELLQLDPTTLTEDELDDALGTAERLIQSLKNDSGSATKLSQGLSQRRVDVVQKHKDLKQEQKRRVREEE